MAVATIDTIDTVSIAGKFQQMGKQLRSELIRRDDEIDIALLALVAMVHVFLLGSPGIAKSLLLERIRLYISGMRLFRKQLHPTTTDPQIWGPFNVGRLKDGHFELVGRGKFQEANVAVFEEMFKAPGSLLQSFLMAINERLYEDDGIEKRLPLATLYGASNELPDDPQLLAFFDRFLFRKEVEELTDWGDIRSLLDLEMDDNPTPILTWAEVQQAQQAAKQVVVSDEAKEALMAIFRALAEAGIFPSSRRKREVLKVVRAAALLDGQTIARPVHAEGLIHCLWQVPTQANDVRKIVLTVTSPGEHESITLADSVAEHVEELDRLLKQPKDNDRTTALMDLYQKFQVDFDEAERLRPTAGGRAARLVDESIDKLRHHGTRLLQAQGMRSAKAFE